MPIINWTNASSAPVSSRLADAVGLVRVAPGGSALGWSTLGAVAGGVLAHAVRMMSNAASPIARRHVLQRCFMVIPVLSLGTNMVSGYWVSGMWRRRGQHPAPNTENLACKCTRALD